MSFRIKLRIKSYKLDWLLANLPKPPPPINREWERAKSAAFGKCAVCGISFVDALGRPVAIGYACQNRDCPSGVSWASTCASVAA